MQKEVLQESQAMIPDSMKRLKVAVEDLKMQIAVSIFILQYFLPITTTQNAGKIDVVVIWMGHYSEVFLSHKINFVTLCFCPFLSQKKKKFFFLRNQEILCFLCILDPGDHLTHSRCNFFVPSVP